MISYAKLKDIVKILIESICNCIVLSETRSAYLAIRHSFLF